MGDYDDQLLPAVILKINGVRNEGDKIKTKETPNFGVLKDKYKDKELE